MLAARDGDGTSRRHVGHQLERTARRPRGDRGGEIGIIVNGIAVYDPRHRRNADLCLAVFVLEYFVIRVIARKILRRVDVAHNGLPAGGELAGEGRLSHADLRAGGQRAVEENGADLSVDLVKEQILLRAAVRVAVDHGRFAHTHVGVAREEHRVLIAVSDLVFGERAVFEDQRSASLGVNTGTAEAVEAGIALDDRAIFQSYRAFIKIQTAAVMSGVAADLAVVQNKRAVVIYDVDTAARPAASAGDPAGSGDRQICAACHLDHLAVIIAGAAGPL